MKPPEAALRQLVRQWFDKATADFEAAEQLSTQGGRFREIVAFHCQQAVEKYLKALLVQRQVEFPKTHADLHVLPVGPSEDPRGPFRQRHLSFTKIVWQNWPRFLETH